MHIAMFLTDFPALSTTFILNQIAGLIDRGHSLDLFALRRSVPGKVHKLVAEYNLEANIRYFHPLPRGKPQRLLGALLLGLREGAWRRPRVMLRTLDVARYGRRARSLELFHHALPLLGRGYDVLHCQFGTLGPLLCDLRDAGVVTGSLLVSFRGYDASQFPRRHPGALERLFRHGDLFLPVSRSLAERIAALGCPRERIRVLHSGIDTARFRFRPRRPPADGPVRLVTVARLVEKKGLAYAIRAVAELRRRGRPVHYTILGDGPLHDDLERLRRRCAVDEVIELAGWCTQDEVLAALGAAHLFLAPSVTAADGDQEGIPNTLKEAMAMGLPVIATDHSGIPELVEDGRSGYLVPERDPTALADAVERLLAAPDTWEAMGRHGRQRVEEGFDNERLNDELIALYRAAPL